MIRQKPVHGQPPAREAGQSLVEFALIAIALLLFMFIIVESGRLFWAWTTVQHAAREGARYAITGQQIHGDLCPVAHLPKFNGALSNNACEVPIDWRPASIISVTHTALSGLPINENSRGDSDPNFYNIKLFGVNTDGDLKGSDIPPENAPFAGDPNLPVTVRVIYRVPIITPILSGIIDSIPLEGVVTMSNESFGQLGNTNQGVGVPPPPPPVPNEAPPEANPDQATTLASETLVWDGAYPDFDEAIGCRLNILCNDKLRGGFIESFQATTTQGGTVALTTDPATGEYNGGFSYTPPGTLTGEDQFEYTLRNGYGADSAVVTILVNPDPPVLVDDGPFEVHVGDVLQSPDPDQGWPHILANDTLNGGELVEFNPTISALGIDVGLRWDALNSQAVFTYIPDPAPNQTYPYDDTFTYKVANVGPPVEATVTIRVLPQLPKANSDAKFTFVNEQLNEVAPGLLLNDIAPNNTQVVPATIVTEQNGQVVLNADGSYVYTPPADFLSPPDDRFFYTIRDEYGQESSAAVTVLVQPKVPLAGHDRSYVTPMNQALTVSAPGVLRNDTTNGATIVRYDNPTVQGGAVTLQPDGSFVYEPPTDFASPPSDSFTYTLENPAGDSTGIVEIFVQPPFPLAVDDFYHTPINTMLRVDADQGVLANDDIESGTVQQYDNITSEGGRVTVLENGSFEYVPPAGFESPPNDSFQYTVGNASGEDTAQVEILVGANPAINPIGGATWLMLGIPTPQGDVVVTLRDSSGAIVTTTTSNVYGAFQFEDLLAGTYTLTACYQLGAMEMSAVRTVQAPTPYGDLFLTPGPCS